MSYDDWKSKEAPDSTQSQRKDPRAKCQECGERCHPRDRHCSVCEALYDAVGAPNSASAV